MLSCSKFMLKLNSKFMNMLCIDDVGREGKGVCQGLEKQISTTCQV